MSIFVLVHGSWHGGWCWYKVVPRLERAGHRVFAPDLPSLGMDKTPVSEVSLDKWTASICAIVDAQPEPVVLVGHSRGGIIISEVAESRPERIRALVYLCAFLLRDGESVLQVVQEDGSSMVLPNLLVSTDQSYSTVRQDAVKEIFYGACSDEDVALAKLLLGPEAMGPAGVPMRIREQNFGRVPRVYIECLRDKAIPPALQKRMYTALPCRKVISMDTDHSPFFSAPEELVAHLTSVARSA